MRRDTRIQCDKVSAVKRVDAGGRGLWWEEDYSSMSCSGGSVYANDYIQVTSLCTSYPKREIFGAWLNKCFVYNEEGIFSYETCRMF